MKHDETIYRPTNWQTPSFVAYCQIAQTTSITKRNSLGRCRHVSTVVFESKEDSWGSLGFERIQQAPSPVNSIVGGRGVLEDSIWRWIVDACYLCIVAAVAPSFFHVNAVIYFLIRPVTLIPLSAPMKKTYILMSDRFQLGPTAVIRGRWQNTDCQVCKMWFSSASEPVLFQRCSEPKAQ